MRKLMAVITLLLVATALMRFTPLGEWNPLSDTVDQAVTSVVDSTTAADTAQCRAIFLTTESTDDCAVLMTPDELKAAAPSAG